MDGVDKFEVNSASQPKFPLSEGWKNGILELCPANRKGEEDGAELESIRPAPILHVNIIQGIN